MLAGVFTRVQQFGRFLEGLAFPWLDAVGLDLKAEHLTGRGVRLYFSLRIKATI
jgi:hypothetical protein